MMMKCGQEEEDAEDEKNTEEKCDDVKGMNSEVGEHFKEENREKKKESEAKSTEEMDEDVVKNEEYQEPRELYRK